MDLYDFIQLAKDYENLSDKQKQALGEMLSNESSMNEWNPRVLQDLKREFLDRRGADSINGATELAEVLEEHLEEVLHD